MLLGGHGTLGPTTGAITAYENSLLRPALSGCLDMISGYEPGRSSPSVENYDCTFVRAVSFVILPAARAHAPCPPSNTLDLAS